MALNLSSGELAMADIPTVRVARFSTGLLLAFLLLLEACVHDPTRDRSTGRGALKQPAIASEADLAKVIAKLNKPETRMQAFAELLAFAEPLSYVHTGNLDADTLHEKANEAVHNCPNLEGTVAGLIGLLEHKDSRMRAMLVLMQFAGPDGSGIYGGTGDAKLDELRKRAAAAVLQCADIETVSQALDSPDRNLQFWGVGLFGGPESTERQPNPLVRLLPKLEKVAVEADANIRSLAVQRLRDYPEARGFLADRVELETSPDVLMHLMRDQTPLDQFNQLFVRRLHSLLNHPDESVRRDALVFVGFNSNRGPMWQFTFDATVLDRVVESTRSQSAEERFDAAYALTDIRRLDLDRSREAFLRLAKDTSSDVRWRVGFGLSDQLDREDVKPVIAALLQDDDPGVRYMTVLAVGAEKHIKELQELAQCPNKQVANWAVEKLKQLGQSR
jgi:hypothetical protein